jgi:hypothetical protein
MRDLKNKTIFYLCAVFILFGTLVGLEMSTPELAHAQQSNTGPPPITAQGLYNAGLFNGGTYEAANTCSTTVPVNVSTAVTTQLVAISGGSTVRVCAWYLVGGGTAAVDTVQFVYGTGALCATGTGNLTGPMAISSATAGNVLGQVAGTNSILRAPIGGQALCLVTTGTAQVAGYVTYTQF